MSLTGKHIVIIGGSSGFGLATAKKAVAAGAEVVIASNSPAGLESAKAELGGKVRAFFVDVASDDSLKEFFEKIGPFDHLVTSIADHLVVPNPDGTFTEGAYGPFLEKNAPLAKRAFEVKFWGQYRAAYYAAPKLREGGSITFFSGCLAGKPERGAVIMGTVNSAVEGLGRALAVELSPIRVNVVSPGLADTPLHAVWSQEKRDAVYGALAASLPAKRIGNAEDMAQAVMYLMSNRFTTGSVLHPDGGTTLR
jgi:NAD(P)-dependent dehydrogenase (short-subunit alcohol dehydrogenase family)